MVATGLLAIAATLRDRFRNVRLKRAIRQSMRLTGFGHGLLGLTAAIHNRTGRTLTIREAVLITSKLECILSPTVEVDSSIKEPEQKLSAEQTERLKRGEAVPVGPPRMAFRPVARGATPTGFVPIEPFTQREFLLPAEGIMEVSGGDPVGIRVVLDYRSWSGEVRIFRETFTHCAEDIRRLVAHLRSELMNGTLNEARRRFHMNEVPVPPTEPHQTT